MNTIPKIQTRTVNASSGNKLMGLYSARRGTVLLAIVAAFGLLLLACGESGPPSPNSNLHLVPAEADALSIVNVAEIDALPDFAESVESDIEEELGLGLAWDDLNQVTRIEWDGNAAAIVTGSFSFNDLRNELENLGIEESSYRGYELWGEYALLEESGYLVIGSNTEAVEEILNNLYRGQRDLAGAEENDLKRILEELPEGSLVEIRVDDSCPVRRCRGVGYTLSGVDLDREVTIWQLALLFSSERAAEDAADEYDDISDFVEFAWDAELEDTTSDGEFVKGTFFERFEEEATVSVAEPSAAVSSWTTARRRLPPS